MFTCCISPTSPLAMFEELNYSIAYSQTAGTSKFVTSQVSILGTGGLKAESESRGTGKLFLRGNCTISQPIWHTVGGLWKRARDANIILAPSAFCGVLWGPVSASGALRRKWASVFINWIYWHTIHTYTHTHMYINIYIYCHVYQVCVW
jgi:hypothetical protein